MVNNSTPQTLQLSEVTRYNHSVGQLFKSLLYLITQGESATVSDLELGKMPMYLVLNTVVTQLLQEVTPEDIS